MALVVLSVLVPMVAGTLLALTNPLQRRRPAAAAAVAAASARGRLGCAISHDATRCPQASRSKR
jgi:hypothetical protein